MADNGLIKSCYRLSKISSKTGNTYQVLVVEFTSGYEIQIFLNKEQVFILNDIPLR